MYSKITKSIDGQVWSGGPMVDMRPINNLPDVLVNGYSCQNCGTRLEEKDQDHDCKDHYHGLE